MMLIPQVEKSKEKGQTIITEEHENVNIPPSSSFLNISKPIETLKKEIKLQKESRIIETLHVIDPYAVKSIFPTEKILASSVYKNDLDNNNRKFTKEEIAAIKIQSIIRGVIGRKLYLSELFKQFEREEQNRLYLTKYQVEEGELLIRENNAKKNLHDAKLINRNRRAVTEYNVRLIQKCCRKWLKRISRNRNKKKEEVEANTNDIDILINTS